MRLARNLAALVALATVGFAVGDFASDPSALGALGVLVLIAVFALLLAYLFRPQEKTRPPRPRPEPRPREPKREHVWAEGWNAEEAQAARERRRR